MSLYMPAEGEVLRSTHEDSVSIDRPICALLGLVIGLGVADIFNIRQAWLPVAIGTAVGLGVGMLVERWAGKHTSD